MNEYYHEEIMNMEEMETVYHRIKWSDEMVKLLITGVAYFVAGNLNSSHDQNNNNNNSNSSSSSNNINHQRKGKWRAISSAMKQRGYLVSPQQCEDKFNDLNKKYKRLNDILGKSTASDVVRNPSVLDSMNLCDETAEEVIKILSTKQLFYQEMCSYHNRNWLFLDHDECLERALNLALNNKNVTRNKSANTIIRGGGGRDSEENMPKSTDQRWIISNYCTDFGTLMLLRDEMEERKLRLQQQRLMLEEKWYKWRKYCQREDRKLEKMRLGNKLMKLQNQRLACELQSLTNKVH